MGEMGPDSTAINDALAGTQWEIRSIDGEAVVLQDPLLVDFGHDGRVSGSTGVNHFTASYTLTADYLTFGPLASTRRSGPPELMRLEARVVGSLAGMCRVYIDGPLLIVEGPLGPVELASTSADRYAQPDLGPGPVGR